MILKTLDDGWMDGWVDGWMDGKAGLRIAYSNQKVNTQIMSIILNTVIFGSFFSSRAHQCLTLTVKNPNNYSTFLFFVNVGTFMHLKYICITFHISIH